MKGKAVLALMLVTTLILAGCETMGEKTKTGAVAGGLLGAVGGGIIGHQSGHGLEGAAIGATVGALSGGLVGSQLDLKAAELDKQARAVNPEYLTLVSIADMGSKGIPDDVIISEIQRTHSVYHLTSEIIAYLKQNKVSDKVINYMLATGG